MIIQSTQYTVKTPNLIEYKPIRNPVVDCVPFTSFYY